MLLYKLKQSTFLQLFIIYTRYLIGSAFVFASIVKIKGERFMVDMKQIENSPFHSTGHFFETLYQSGIYWRFLGISQLIAAFLLMTQRFSKLGALAFFPIILNIFVITISYSFGGTSTIAALMLLANTMLLVWDWEELKILLNLKSPKYEIKCEFEKQQIWEICGLIIFIFTLVYRTFITSFIAFLFWIGGCLLIGLVCFLIELRKKKIL